MAAEEKVRIDNFQALMIAVKQVVPFAVLFYAIDYFLYADNGPAALRSSMLVSTLFIVGFLIIDFFRARSRMKAIANAPPPQVIYVQQPVYVQGPPPYGYPPYGTQGQPGQPQGQPYYPQYPPPYGAPPPQQLPPAGPTEQPPRKRPPEGTA